MVSYIDIVYNFSTIQCHIILIIFRTFSSKREEEKEVAPAKRYWCRLLATQCIFNQVRYRNFIISILFRNMKHPALSYNNNFCFCFQPQWEFTNTTKNSMENQHIMERIINDFTFLLDLDGYQDQHQEGTLVIFTTKIQQLYVHTSSRMFIGCMFLTIFGTMIQLLWLDVQIKRLIVSIEPEIV